MCLQRMMISNHSFITIQFIDYYCGQSTYSIYTYKYIEDSTVNLDQTHDSLCDITRVSLNTKYVREIY